MADPAKMVLADRQVGTGPAIGEGRHEDSSQNDHYGGDREEFDQRKGLIFENALKCSSIGRIYNFHRIRLYRIPESLEGRDPGDWIGPSDDRHAVTRSPGRGQAGC